MTKYVGPPYTLEQIEKSLETLEILRQWIAVPVIGAITDYDAKTLSFNDVLKFTVAHLQSCQVTLKQNHFVSPQQAYERAMSVIK